ncbi:MAG: hypothetical protein QOH21_2352 [Acidobacteriota bacterium]|jgi:hypothetical protein|nr:hypothetical protein [Acidobacteriota bacterium]
MPDVHPDDAPEAARLFRREALEQYQRGSADEGHLLEIEPAWMRASVVIVVLVVAALVAGLVWWLRV